jgi:hypothetical protein
MDDSEIIDMFWRRTEQTLSVCQEKFGAYRYKVALAFTTCNWLFQRLVRKQRERFLTNEIMMIILNMLSSCAKIDEYSLF